MAKTSQKIVASRRGKGPVYTPLTPEALALRCLDETLHQAKVLFWFSLIAGSMATVIQVCVIVCGIVHQHTEFQIAAKLLIGLPFNAVAVVAYKQARDFRRWASSLVISTHGINPTPSGGRSADDGDKQMADLLLSLPPTRLNLLDVVDPLCRHCKDSDEERDSDEEAA
jgi:hypothetical protein